MLQSQHYQQYFIVKQPKFDCIGSFSADTGSLKKAVFLKEVEFKIDITFTVMTIIIIIMIIKSKISV